MTTEEIELPKPGTDGMTDAECEEHMRHVEAEELLCDMAAAMHDPIFVCAFEGEMVLYLSETVSKEEALKLIKPLVGILRQHEARGHAAMEQAKSGTIQ